MKDDTKAVTAGRDPQRDLGAVNVPVYRASTILARSLGEFEERVARRLERGTLLYGRYGTPTTFALQDAVAALEGGEACLATASGLNAISTALLAYLGAGDHLLVTDSVYRRTRDFCDQTLSRLGVEVEYFDPLIGAGIANLMRPNTRLVHLESPGSLTFEVQDVPAIADVAHHHGAVVAVDNSWATPLYCKPLALGADLSIQAATKYVVGHSDAMVGTVTTTEAAWPRLRDTAYTLGVHCSPDDAYLALRGLRTMAVRLARHQQTAMAAAEWLAARPEVARVLYPGHPADPGHALWRRDFSGASGLMSVVLSRPYSREAIAAMVDGYRLFGIGASWGGFESLVLVAHLAQKRSATSWDAPGPTIRYHFGLESAEDLMADLEQGFARLNGAG